MKIEKRGEGKAEFTIVGSIHGDEPCGKNAIERFLNSDYEVNKPVKFIIANEEALEENVRYIDDDLNRIFPGDKDSESHERKLAAEIMEEVEGRLLDIHSTQSYPEPFATMTYLNEKTISMAVSANVEKICQFPEDSGTLESQFEGIIIEAGKQGTNQAAENAYKVILNFLAAHGVIEEKYEKSDPEVFRYVETVDRQDFRFTAENFRKVKKGQVYAKHENEVLRAENDFYPVLMSTSGYDEMLGFKAERLGKASEIQ